MTVRVESESKTIAVLGETLRLPFTWPLTPLSTRVVRL